MAAIGIATAPQATEDFPASPLRNRELADWQHRLLPFMRWFVVGLASAFFAFSAWNLDEVNDFIEKEHDSQKKQESAQLPTMPSVTAIEKNQSQRFDLEADALDRRYHQRSALLMSGICTKQLAFIAGIVLALLGAMFIMGKLSESPSNISGGTSKWHVAITSASPGIILCFLGTVVLLASLTMEISIPDHDNDTPVYFSTTAAGLEARGNAPAKNNSESHPRQQQKPDLRPDAQAESQQRSRDSGN